MAFFFASRKIKLWLSYLPKFTINSHKTLKCTFQSAACILCQVSSMMWILYHAEQRVNAVLSFRYSVYPFSVLSQHGIKHPKPVPFFGNLFMFQQVTLKKRSYPDPPILIRISVLYFCLVFLSLWTFVPGLLWPSQWSHKDTWQSLWVSWGTSTFFYFLTSSEVLELVDFILLDTF